MKKTLLLLSFLPSLAFAHHPAPPPPPPPPPPVIMPVEAPVTVIPAIPVTGEPSTLPPTPGWLLKVACGAATVVIAVSNWEVLAARYVVAVTGIYTVKAYRDGPDARGQGHDLAQAGFSCIALPMGG